ncbi:MAG: hypothetical protein JXB88_25725 [Spirochaetales bacterium]|nr:hypothetical protein [Spirochaetales bacterium]
MKEKAVCKNRKTIGFLIDRIDSALEEIKKNSGILYDERVLDAWIRLFTEKGYVLK